jgi:hypothetical protein
MKTIPRNFLLFLGIAFLLIATMAEIYSASLARTQKASYNTLPVVSSGGPDSGELIQIEAPSSLRVSDTGIIKVNYMFIAPSQEVNSPGQPSVRKDIQIALQTASFDTAPPSGQPIERQLKVGIRYEWTWVIKPQQEGEHIIIMQFGGISGPGLAEIASTLGIDQLPANSTLMNASNWSEQINDPEYIFNLAIPISVVDVFGLSAIQARVVNNVVTFLGSGLTLVWLYEQWQKRHSQGNAKQRRGKRK